MLGEEKNNIQIKKSSSGGSLFGLLMVLVAIAGYMFLIRPLSVNLESAKASVADQETQKTTLQSRVDAMQKAKSDLGLDSEVKRSETLKAIPTAMYQDEVIRDLIRILEKHDVVLNSIGFADSGSSYESIGVLRVSASFDGSYSDLEGFLRSLETNQRIFQVETINVQVEGQSSGFERVGFSLTINVFYQKTK